MHISSAEFRVNCFKILDKIEQTHEEVIITKRGRPIARLIRVESRDGKDPLLGSLTGMGRTIGDLTKPVVDADTWEMD